MVEIKHVHQHQASSTEASFSWVLLVAESRGLAEVLLSNSVLSRPTTSLITASIKWFYRIPSAIIMLQAKHGTLIFKETKMIWAYTFYQLYASVE